jgi:hypothetical protein
MPTETTKIPVIINEYPRELKIFPFAILNHSFIYYAKFLIPPETNARGLLILN